MDIIHNLDISRDFAGPSTDRISNLRYEIRARERLRNDLRRASRTLLTSRRVNLQKFDLFCVMTARMRLEITAVV